MNPNMMSSQPQAPQSAEITQHVAQPRPAHTLPVKREKDPNYCIANKPQRVRENFLKGYPKFKRHLTVDIYIMMIDKWLKIWKIDKNTIENAETLKHLLFEGVLDSIENERSVSLNPAKYPHN